MAEILIADITVTITKRLKEGKRRRTEGTLSFGDGVSTMPPDGIPLPAIGVFGMIRELTELRVTARDDTSAQPYVYQSVDHKLLETDNLSEDSLPDGVRKFALGDDVPLKRTLNFVATGW